MEIKGQTSLFDVIGMTVPKLKLDKPVRLIELFSGIGAQAKAFENLGIDFEPYKTAEWEYHAVLSYKAIHCPEDKIDYSEEFDKDFIANYLYRVGISSDGKKPMMYPQVVRLGERRLRQIFNAYKATHNIGSIVNAKAEDLEIKYTDKYTYFLTYSFPCQDLSNAGKQAGMAKGAGTRSGMLWEVERLLMECKEKPQILLMENVPQIHSKKNMPDFQMWIDSLAEMGYTSVYEDLNAKDFGVPQNRNRTFMVSWLGDYSYEFPEGFELKLRLKDVLDEVVDEKYYLSQEAVDGLVRQMDPTIPH